MLKSYLNEVEEFELKKLAENETMRRAFKKFLLEFVYHSGTLQAGEEPLPLVNYCLSLAARNKGLGLGLKDEAIGAEMRAIYEGVNMIEDGFKELDKFKNNIETKQEKPNPAR